MRRRKGGAPAGSPSTATVPLSTIWTPTMQRISVVFPEPLGPRSPVRRPRAIVRLIPGRTRLPPRRTVRASTVIAGSVITTAYERGEVSVVLRTRFSGNPDGSSVCRGEAVVGAMTLTASARSIPGTPRQDVLLDGRHRLVTA